MAKIRIEKSLCMQCGQCVDICPEGLFVQASAGKPPRIQRIRDCIECGHCASICPTGAVQHVNFPFAVKREDMD